MEKVAAVLGSVLKLDPASINLETDEGIQAIEARAKELKVFTTDEHNSVLNNYRESLKDTFYKDHKINIHAAIEKQLVDKYELDAESLKGKKTEDYIEAAIQKHKAANPGTPPANDKELEKLTKLLQDQKSEYERQIGETKKQYDERIKGLHLDSALSGVKSLLDIEDADKAAAQIEFIKYQFGKEYNLVEQDGKYVVMKGEDIVRDSNFVPVTVESVLSEIAEKFAPLKKKAPAGRKPEPGGKSGNSSIDWSAFSTFDDFMQTERGKNLIMGSKEWVDMYGQFKKAKGLA